jgi:hypothetical protein
MKLIKLMIVLGIYFTYFLLQMVIVAVTCK